MTDDADRRAFFEREIAGLLDRLYGAALRLAKNRADAEDLVAEAVAKAWANLGTLHDRRCFRGWIFRILTNTFLTECRKSGATSIETLPETASAGNDPPFSLFEQLHQPFLLWWGNPEQEFLNKVLREDLETAIDELPEVFRLPVILCDLQGFTYQEIAAMIEAPVGTVRSRLARGRGALQAALWRQAREIGLRSTTATEPSLDTTSNSSPTSHSHHETEKHGQL